MTGSTASMSAMAWQDFLPEVCQRSRRRLGCGWLRHARPVRMEFRRLRLYRQRRRHHGPDVRWARCNWGYFQAAYTFAGGWFLPNALTVGASWGVSHLETAGVNDNFVNLSDCGVFSGVQTSCLVRDNESWIGFARYKLTKWVNLQAEYIHTISENQLGQRLFDNAGTVGATFFW